LAGGVSGGNACGLGTDEAGQGLGGELDRPCLGFAERLFAALGTSRVVGAVPVMPPRMVPLTRNGGPPAILFSTASSRRTA
jgi:hypothetical protein